MASLLFLLIIPLLFSSCTQAKRAELDAPAGWKRIEAGKFFTFRAPKSMELVSEATCMECLWGSTYSNSRIRLGVEFTSWNEEYAAEDLARQSNYIKQMETIDGHRAKIQSWRLQKPEDGYNFTHDLRVYDPRTRKLKATMTALCKAASDLETTKLIFKTIHFL